jgi:hypothetical protein
MLEVKTDQEIYNELAIYTLSLGDKEFIHQYMVDTFAAQHANKDTKPITLAFALVGLYLHLEKGYSGKEVQEAHMQMAKEKQDWPVFPIPQFKGKIKIKDVMNTEPGEKRNEMINKWSKSVWDAYKDSHHQIRNWIETKLKR